LPVGPNLTDMMELPCPSRDLWNQKPWASYVKLTLGQTGLQKGFRYLMSQLTIGSPRPI